MLRLKRLVHNQSPSSTDDVLKGTTAVTVKNPLPFSRTIRTLTLPSNEWQKAAVQQMYVAGEGLIVLLTLMLSHRWPVLTVESEGNNTQFY